MIFLRLFAEFFKTGLFAVGGGLATLPFLRDMAGRTGWFSEKDLADMIAVAESTPGPIGVNTATFAGYKTAGIGGAAAATVGLILPSLLIILMIAAFLQSFRQNRWVAGLFSGLRPASVALIAAAGLSLCGTAFFSGGAVNAKALALAAILLYFSFFCKKTKEWHPLVFILFSAVFGIAFQM